MKIWTTLLSFIITFSVFGQTNNELEYLKFRDNYISYFKNTSEINRDWTKIDKQDNDSILVLEKMLREVLKGSKNDSVVKYGKINIETLQQDLGFGMLDGLVLNKNSSNTLQIFVTSKTLFFDCFKSQQINSIDNLAPRQFDDILTALVSDAHATVFYSEKISSNKRIQVYGGILTITQDIGRFTPDIIFTLISNGNYIYIIQKYLDKPIHEMKECQAIYDSIYSNSKEYFKAYQASYLQDTTAFNKTTKMEEIAWNKYCECYQKNFRTDEQFEPIIRQIKNMVQYSILKDNVAANSRFEISRVSYSADNFVIGSYIYASKKISVKSMPIENLQNIISGRRKENTNLLAKICSF
jgi:hypothetical protein